MQFPGGLISQLIGLVSGLVTEIDDPIADGARASDWSAGSVVTNSMDEGAV
jgi:hypothetical protein